MTTLSQPPFSWAVLVAALLLLAAPAAALARPGAEPGRFTTRLDDGWQIQAAALVPEDGAELSSPDHPPSGWLPARVPTTVMAALVANGRFQDLYRGTRLDQVPREEVLRPWWFRREIEVKAPFPESARLVFEGVNYRADVWLNGKRVTSSHELVGTFRTFDLDVHTLLRPGKNVLAVLVHPPQPGDYTIGFVDWNPRPPDENLGLFRPVKLRTTGAVSLEAPFVETRLAPDHERAALTLRATLVNRTTKPVQVSLRGGIEGNGFEHTVELQAQESREIRVGPDQVPALDLLRPRLWWPYGYGDPALYTLQLETVVAGAATDAREVRFGIREVTDYLNDGGHRGYKVNGIPILIRGGGWVDDLLLAEDEDDLEAQLRYVRQMNLNTVRLEGFWGSSQRLYDLADRLGILVMVGFSCQWEWEGYLGRPVDDYGGGLTRPEQDLLDRYLADQVVWLRHHPSVFVWVVGSDTIPRPELERRFQKTLERVDPTRPYLAGCKGKTSTLSGPTAVKMEGPYDYVVPGYWYLDRQRGGAYGFNTETGPGPQPPPLDSLRRMLPEDHRWPIDEVWDFHCGRNEFGNLDRYRQALDQRYGPPESLEEFARLAQAANYEAVRAMFEAFAVRRPEATGVIQWMLNAAWPKLYWQLYDRYLLPNGAFYGTRVACQAQSLVYDYGDHAVFATNDRPRALTGLTAEVRVLDADSRPVLERRIPVALEPLASTKLLDLDGVATDTPVHFLSLRLVQADGAELARNFYWLSSRDDVPDWERSTWFYTPTREYADLTALGRLPPARVTASLDLADLGETRRAQVTLHNRSDKVAFFIELGLVGKRSQRPLRPVYWDDNYVSLLPGETRTLAAEYPARLLPNEVPELSISGFNLAPRE
jgi:exo-1,4-beta-D-glucosaminidase